MAHGHRAELGCKPDAVAVEYQRRRSHRRGLVNVGIVVVAVAVMVVAVVVHRGSTRRLQELASSLTSVGYQETGPTHKGLIGNKKGIVDQLEKDELVGVDLFDRQARDLGPGLVRVVAVLEILGGHHQGSEKGASATINDAVRLTRRR